jgi:hypothetical protein
MVTYELFGPIDSILGAKLLEQFPASGAPIIQNVYAIELVLLALVFGNIAARFLAHRQHVAQAEDGPEAISRHPLHVATNVLLVLGSFYYLTIAQHAGMVTSVLVLTTLITDVFEFESRKVEARRELDLDRPKAAIASSVLALVYLSYVTFLYGPIGSLI